MVRTSSLVLDADGTLIVRHVAPPGPPAEALRHEAVVLDRARGLGVVELLGAFDEPDGSAVLSTRFVPGGTLADLAREDAGRAALRVLARVAGILADLHQAGIVHGRCTADHVVGAGQQVALCGFAEALLGSAGDPPDVLADTEGFALLVDDVCADDSEASRRARRAAAGLAGPTQSTNLRVVAAELAALAGSDADGRERVLRPRGAVASPATARWGALWRRTSASPGRAAAVAGLALGLGLLGALAARASGGPGDAGLDAVRPVDRAGAARAGNRVEVDGRAEEVEVDGRDAAGGTATSGGPEGDGPHPTGPVRVWPEPLDGEATGAPSPPPTPPPAAPDPAPGGAAGVVVHEGVRYQVGAAGDLVVVGDWDCDGIATASLVRPADGSVWTFPTWAAAGEVVVADALGHAPAPVAATVVAAPDGCEAIAVTTADGREVVVDPT